MTDSHLDPLTVPESIRQAIFRRVEADLSPSPRIVHAKVAVAVVLGGLLSLFFCGQFGLGLSGVARDVHVWIVEHTGPLGCTALCGSVFAFIPVSILRLLSPPLQFRAIMHRHWFPLIAWLGLFGGAVVARNQSLSPIWELLVWLVAAVLSFRILAVVVGEIDSTIYRLSDRLRA